MANWYCLSFRGTEFILLLGFIGENVLNKDVKVPCLLEEANSKEEVSFLDMLNIKKNEGV